MDSPINEDTQGVGLGASQNLFSISSPGNKPQSPLESKAETPRGFENHRNSAACFLNKNKREKWNADYIGCLVVEDLPTGSKHWVNISERKRKNGDTYLAMVLRPWRGKGRAEARE